MGKFIGHLDEAAKKGGLMGSVFQGVGQQLGKMAFGAVVGGIKDLVGALGDSIGMAREEEVGIKRLDTALTSNVKGYDGNRDAIEKVIAEREKLAFSDGEQRDSLAKLVAKTHDSTKALQIQRIAMDLSRLRGIDLATSSELLGKVYDGNTAVLKRYGIHVKAGATATEALAQVQAQAAGQAETFANTTEGASLSMKIALDDVMEEIGSALLPIIKDLAVFIRDSVIPALRDMGKFIGDLVGFIKPAVDGVGALVGQLGGLKGALDAIEMHPAFWADKMQSDAFAAKKAIEEMSAATGYSFDDMVDRVNAKAAEWGVAPIDAAVRMKDGVIYQADLMAKEMDAAAERGRQAVADRFIELPKIVSDITTRAGEDAGVGFGFGLQTAHEKLLATAYQVVKPLKDRIAEAARQAHIKGKLIPENLSKGIREDMHLVSEAERELKWQMEHPLDVAADRAWLLGKLGGKRLAKGLRSANPDIRAAAEAEEAAIIKTLSDLYDKMYPHGKDAGEGFKDGLAYELRLAIGNTQYSVNKINAIMRGASGDPTHTGGGYRAKGGPVEAFGTYVVGEEGPEVLTMGASGGHVWANRGGGKPSSGGGGGGAGTTINATINIQSLVPTSVTQAKDIGRALLPEIMREARRQGFRFQTG